MPFDYATFKTLTGGFHLGSSSVDHLRTLVDTPANRIADLQAHARAVVRAMELMPVIKIEKYKAGLIYLIENYSPLIAENPPAPRHPRRDGRRRQFTTEITAEKLDRGDLLYGIGTDNARAHPRYMGALFTGPRYADVYNNGFGIGTGAAFNRGGAVAPTAESVRAHIGTVELRPEDATAPMRRAYIEGLMASRFAPTTVFDTPIADLARNNNTGLGASTPEARRIAYWNKAIRRACKYGLEMVATDPVFTGRRAEVHFVLDGLGNLMSMAMKKSLDESLGRAIRSDYVPITSSEICFVFRKWDKLKNVVRFWVNGQEVEAPWLSEWAEVDVSGKAVSSAWGHWQRYALKRKIIKGKG